MVVTGVVAILLAISLPALSASRQRAETMICASRVNSIMQLHAVYSADHDGQWANALPPGASAVEWRFQGLSIRAWGVLVQTGVWNGPLQSGGHYDADEPQEPWSCPVAYREWSDESSQPSAAHDAPMRSYLYSAAMFTRADLWDPTRTVPREALDEYRHEVGVHEVRYPSKKVAISERREWHDSGIELDGPASSAEKKEAAIVNAGFADGHVSSVKIGDAQPAIPQQWPSYFSDSSRWAIPFSAAAWGYRGRDY